MGATQDAAMEQHSPDVEFETGRTADIPGGQLCRHLERRLEEHSPDALGYIQAASGGYLVHLTISHASLASLVDAAVDEFRQVVPANISLPRISVVADVKHSMRVLSLLQDEVRARSDELEARGIRWMHLGVNVWINRLEIGVKALTDEKRRFLEREFGADRIHVFEGGGWHGYAPLPASDS